MLRPKGRLKPRAKTVDVCRVFPGGLAQYRNNMQPIFNLTQPQAVQCVELSFETRHDLDAYSDGELRK